MGRAWTALRRHGDVVLACVTTGVVVAFLAVGNDVRPRAALIALGVVQAGVLIWRRSRPVPAVLASMAAYVVMNVVSAGEFPPDIAVVPAMLAVYAGAAYTGGRTARVLGVLTLVAVEAAWVAGPDQDLGDFLPLLFWGGPFVVGRLARSRALALAALTAQTALLEERREADAAEATLRERDRIARELHDVVAHAVSVMVVQAGAARLAAQRGGVAADAAEVFDTIEQTGREALGELRAMLGVLRDPRPGESGELAAPDDDAIERLVARMRASGMPVELKVEGAPIALSPAVASAAYRIAQESLTNVVKHAGAVPCAIRCAYHSSALEVEVRNAAPKEQRAELSDGSGFGVLGMQERVRFLGGSFRAGPTSDGGWSVCARLPFERSAAVID